ncbi:MAG: hypothetical protein WCE62_07215 [Polyangiales bacterium]
MHPTRMVESSLEFVREFKTLSEPDVLVAGGKGAANLGELIDAV